MTRPTTIDTSSLPEAVDAYLSTHRSQRVEFGFGIHTAHGTDEYTTDAALVRNAIALAILPSMYAECTNERRAPGEYNPPRGCDWGRAMQGHGFPVETGDIRVFGYEERSWTP